MGLEIYGIMGLAWFVFFVWTIYDLWTTGKKRTLNTKWTWTFMFFLTVGFANIVYLFIRKKLK